MGIYIITWQTTHYETDLMESQSIGPNILAPYRCESMWRVTILVRM